MKEIEIKDNELRWVLNKHTSEAFEIVGNDVRNGVYVLCKDGDVESRWAYRLVYRHFHRLYHPFGDWA